jgi:hypothetical protein
MFPSFPTGSCEKGSASKALSARAISSLALAGAAYNEWTGSTHRLQYSLLAFLPASSSVREYCG